MEQFEGQVIIITIIIINTDERSTTTSHSNYLAVRIYFKHWRKCLDDKPVAVFSIRFILYWISLLYLPMLYLVSMISNEEGKIGHWILLMHGTLPLCPCHLFDACTQSPFFPPILPHYNKAIHLLPLSLQKAERWVFEICAGYPFPNELGGLQWGRNICCSNWKALSDMIRVITKRWGTKSWCWLTYYKEDAGIFYSLIHHVFEFSLVTGC